MEMEGWNWEDAAHSVDIAVHMNWPPRMKREFEFSLLSLSQRIR